MIDLTQSTTNWSIGMKLRRGIWTFMIEPLVRWLPKVCSPLRVAALRAMGAKIGPRCLILPGVRVLMPWNLKLDGFVAIGQCVEIYNFAAVSIGRMTVVSQYTYLCTGSHDYRRGHMPLTYDAISIGAQCWLAAGTFVSPGVHIAEGCVIGAKSVVTKSLTEPWFVYAGNPCRRLKRREMLSA